MGGIKDKERKRLAFFVLLRGFEGLSVGVSERGPEYV